jgi:hypothetical protein
VGVEGEEALLLGADLVDVHPVEAGFELPGDGLNVAFGIRAIRHHVGSLQRRDRGHGLHALRE